MRKAFTLLEFMVVLVVIGILGTLAAGQYARTVEQSRSSEAKAVIGVIRGLALAHYNEFDTLLPGDPNDFDSTQANIGTGASKIPNTPSSSHFFTYDVSEVSDTTAKIVAKRCSGGGCKGGATAYKDETISLNVTCPAGTDLWEYSTNAPWR